MCVVGLGSSPACTSPICKNGPLERFDPNAGYRFENIRPGAGNTDDVFVVLTFSGGGTRAAAVAYGVLEGLREIQIGGGGPVIGDGVTPAHAMNMGDAPARAGGRHRKQESKNTHAMNPGDTPARAGGSDLHVNRAGGSDLHVNRSGGSEIQARGVQEWEKPKRSLLDEVDVISSVSGGSFTAMYYVLNREAIFDEGAKGFKKQFLKRDIQGRLLNLVLDPLNLLRLMYSVFDRTDLAADYYDRDLFDHRTYAELLDRGDRPFVVVNATNMSAGLRFEFTQGDFDFLGSDLATLPVARAVAASSAFPLLLSPLRLQYFPGDPCNEAIRRIAREDVSRNGEHWRHRKLVDTLLPPVDEKSGRRSDSKDTAHEQWHKSDESRDRASGRASTAQEQWHRSSESDEHETDHTSTVQKQGHDHESSERDDDRELRLDEANHKYMYLLDGGVTDNLGVHWLVEQYRFGVLRKKIDDGSIKKLVVIVVNAGTEEPDEIERNSSSPGLFLMGIKAGEIGLITHTRTMAEVVRFMLEEDPRRQRELHTQYERDISQKCPEALPLTDHHRAQVDTHLIEVNFRSIKDANVRKRCLSMPTTLFLFDSDVDTLIEVGRQQVLEHPELAEILKDLR